MPLRSGRNLSAPPVSDYSLGGMLILHMDHFAGNIGVFCLLRRGVENGLWLKPCRDFLELIQRIAVAFPGLVRHVER